MREQDVYVWVVADFGYFATKPGLAPAGDPLVLRRPEKVSKEKATLLSALRCAALRASCGALSSRRLANTLPFRQARAAIP